MKTSIFRAVPVVAVAILGATTVVGTVSKTAHADTVVEFPAPEYVAAISPVYFENHANYWWHNKWYWRDHVGWHGYDKEPAFLAEHRSHDWAARWWFYGTHDSHGNGFFGHDWRGAHRGHEEVPGHEGHEGHEEHHEEHGKHK